MKPVARALTIAIAVALGLAAGQADAQKYPNKPVRMLVPFAPGGGTDIVARAIAQKMTETLGQAVVVDNRPGAGGTIGAETGVRAQPDGYTLVMVSGSYATNAALYKLPYDPVNDIQAIALMGETGFVLAVHPNVPAKSVTELIAYAKAKPGVLNYASTGTGGITHLATELFNLMAATKMTHVPFKGTGPAVTALMGDQVQLIMGAMPAMIPLVKQNRVRALGVSTEKPAAALPGVPTIGQTVKGYEAVLWYGLWGPKKLPQDIVATWNKGVGQALQSKEMQERMAGEGLEGGGGPPDRFLKVLARDVVKWKRVVKEAKVTISS